MFYQFNFLFTNPKATKGAKTFCLKYDDKCIYFRFVSKNRIAKQMNYISCSILNKHDISLFGIDPYRNANSILKEENLNNSYKKPLFCIGNDLWYSLQFQSNSNKLPIIQSVTPSGNNIEINPLSCLICLSDFTNNYTNDSNKLKSNVEAKYQLVYKHYHTYHNNHGIGNFVEYRELIDKSLFNKSIIINSYEKDNKDSKNKKRKYHRFQSNVDLYEVHCNNSNNSTNLNTHKLKEDVEKIHNINRKLPYHFPNYLFQKKSIQFITVPT